jgi:hypothetical protein
MIEIRLRKGVVEDIFSDLFLIQIKPATRNKRDKGSRYRCLAISEKTEFEVFKTSYICP